MRYLTIFLLFLLLFACNDDSNNTETGCKLQQQQLETEIKTALDSAETDTDFTLMITDQAGNSLIHSTGNSTATTSYRSASTSKLVTAVVILNVVKQGKLSLDDHPQKYITTWPATGHLSEIRLRDLLNFTSGLSEEPLCINLAGAVFENCVNNIATANSEAKAPGAEFYYSGSHLQVAGLMAIKATGADSWETLFDQFKTETGLFPNSSYNLPSATNPRLAGGMQWQGVDYLAFLKALYTRSILTEELLDQLFSDQLNGATVAYSPALEGVKEDWHYGFGNWIECHNSSFNCCGITRVSSPGAYGAYPFIDFQYSYYGILAREGALGTYAKGYQLFEMVAPKLEQWATICSHN